MKCLEADTVSCYYTDTLHSFACLCQYRVDAETRFAWELSCLGTLVASTNDQWNSIVARNILTCQMFSISTCTGLLDFPRTDVMILVVVALTLELVPDIATMTVVGAITRA